MALMKQSSKRTFSSIEAWKAHFFPAQVTAEREANASLEDILQARVAAIFNKERETSNVAAQARTPC